MIRLTDEEIEAVDEACGADVEDIIPFIAKAQLKKVVGWLDEGCEEHNHTINISGFEHKVAVRRGDCRECWQALLGEVGLNKEEQ